MSLETELTTIARDVGPDLLAPLTQQTPSSSEMEVDAFEFRPKWALITSHPRLEAAIEALASDPARAPLSFDASGRGMSLRSRESGGGAVNADVLVRQILIASAQEAHLLAAMGEMSGLEGLVINNLELLREAVGGRDVQV